MQYLIIFLICVQTMVYADNNIIKELTSECASVTQIGLNSLTHTHSLLEGLSMSSDEKKTFLGIDTIMPTPEQLNFLIKEAQKHHIVLKTWPVDPQYIEIEPTDFLQIDTVNDENFLQYALKTFSKRVNKYICLKDSSDLIYAFLEQDLEWELYPIQKADLIILKRKENTLARYFTYDDRVDDYLKNKIILCTGPSFGKYDLLKTTVESDSHMIPFKKVFIATNDPNIRGITFNGKVPHCEYFEARGHHIDCYDCILKTLKNAAFDREVLDNDIILFKHESLFINDMHLIKKSVEKLLNGYNMIARSLAFGMATDGFFVRVSAIKDWIAKVPYITERFKNFCAECYFKKEIVKQTSNVYSIVVSSKPMKNPKNYSHWKNTQIGLYHICPPHKNPEKDVDIVKMKWWDKANYDTIFEEEAI